jgi:crotonobetainyl-CoA:carnitine CoA-transferase CaiB-like acyl-CoA transferase
MVLMSASAPLDGLKVVDFTRLFAGPLCTMVLADLGAEVIKVEAPGGDDARHFGPPFLGGEGMNFMALNRGKQSVVLDLKSEAGRRAAAALTADADIVVENFRPGVAERIGIGEADLRPGNPRMIYCSISGFGPAEEFDRKPALDLILQALTGVLSRQGHLDGEPRLACITVADTYAAAQAVQGILASLYVREKTGEGQRVDVSLLEAILTAQAYRVIVDPEVMELPAFDDTIPYQAFQGSDGGWLAIAVVSKANWTALCQVLGLEELVDDYRFHTNPARVDHREELIPLLAERFATRPREEWLTELEAGGVPCSQVQELTDLMADPEMLSSGVLAEVAGTIRTLGPAIHFSKTPSRTSAAAPRLGEHSETVLRAAGLDEETVGECLRQNP